MGGCPGDQDSLPDQACLVTPDGDPKSIIIFSKSNPALLILIWDTKMYIWCFYVAVHFNQFWSKENLIVDL